MTTFYDTFMPRVNRSRKFREYRVVCWKFAKYLDYTTEKTFVLQGYDTMACCAVSKELPYVHRFTSIYLRALYAKLSQLERWYVEHKTPVFLLSLTTSSKGKTIREAFEELRAGWRNFAHVLRNFRRTRDIEYLYVYEPHKSGYPHMHVVLFGDLSDDDIERLRRLWSESYGIGSYEHGLHVSKPRKHQEVEHVRAYILKYVSKSLDFENMSVAHFVFLAVLWSFYDRSQWSTKIPYWTASGKFAPKSTGGGAFRLWGSSRCLTAAMQYVPAEIDASQAGVNWARYGETIPEVVRRLSKQSAADFLFGNACK